jgi:Cu/Ag efflux pump CusA
MLRVLGKQVQAAMQDVPGVVDLSTEQQQDIPTLQVKVNAASAARLGMQTGEAADAIQTAYVGKEVTRVLEGQVSFPLAVRYGQEESRSVRAIRDTLIDTPSGARVPLSAIANISEDRGPNFIMREFVQRRIVVQCNVAGRDLVGTVKDIQTRVAAQVKLPQGYHIEYGGQFEAESQATRLLLILGGLALVAMVFLLATVFRSITDAGVILINLPLALVGGVAGVFAGGGVLSVASIIGFITLFGIATRNGIMLVSHIRHLMEVEGVAAGLALIPIALGKGQPGSEIQAPMAFVILFGLVSSTFLNMFVVPAAWLIAHKTFDRTLQVTVTPKSLSPDLLETRP